jgi:hypothetical protein
VLGWVVLQGHLGMEGFRGRIVHRLGGGASYIGLGADSLCTGQVLQVHHLGADRGAGGC